MSFYGPGIFDEIDFQMYGYGGFGYDTSHIKPDSAQPAIVTASGHGNLEELRSLVERSSRSEIPTAESVARANDATALASPRFAAMLEKVRSKEREASKLPSSNPQEFDTPVKKRKLASGVTVLDHNKF